MYRKKEWSKNKAKYKYSSANGREGDKCRNVAAMGFHILAKTLKLTFQPNSVQPSDTFGLSILIQLLRALTYEQVEYWNSFVEIQIGKR